MALVEKSEKQYLEEFIHENTDLVTLEDLADQFNIFAALGVIDLEIKHSNFLAWLMNPMETHGLADYFLTDFLRTVAHKVSTLNLQGPSVFDIDSWKFEQADVHREWRDIDIFIRCEDLKFVCMIENKLRSQEQHGQLKRYKTLIETEFPGYRKYYVYLTIEGDVPSEDEYVPLSHGEVVALVERLIETKRGKVGNEIMSFITHYRDMLRRFIMRDSEIQEICKRIYRRHKKALDLIFENKPDRLLDIYERFVGVLEGDSEFLMDKSSKSYIRFLPKDLDFLPKIGEGWTKTKRILLFECYNHTDGIDISLIVGPGPQKIRNELYGIAQNHLALFNKAQRKLTEYWFTLYKKRLLTAKGYEDKTSEEIDTTIAEKIEKFKKGDLVKIKDEILKYGKQKGLS